MFLDRDGTLNVQVVRDGLPYPPAGPKDFQLFPDAADACRRLKQAGFLLVVVTNQPDVGRGTARQSDVEQMHRLLQSWIPELDRIEVCYDPGRGERSRRRKPEPGMIHDAAGALDVDLSRSWMVGDRWRDVDCGKRAGVRTIFIDRGYVEALREPPDATVASMHAATDYILAQDPLS